jgi:hypothetical protein
VIGSGAVNGHGDKSPRDTTSPDGDDDLSDDEILWFATLVEESVSEGLTAARFEAVVSTFLFDLDDEQGRIVRARIFAELPDRLRMSMLGDVLTQAGARQAEHPDPSDTGTFCRCCRQPFEPLQFVDENGICPDCWDFPVLDRAEHGSQRGAA